MSSNKDGGTFAPRERLRALVPDLINYSTDLVYGEIWERPNLSKRDRSLITIAYLLGQSRPAQISVHADRGMDNGLTPEEISEAITHLAFYAGWPAAMAAAEAILPVMEARKSSK